MAAGGVSLRSVFLALFLEALSLHLIQLRDVNFQSTVRYVLSPSFGVSQARVGGFLSLDQIYREETEGTLLDPCESSIPSTDILPVSYSFVVI